jgi:hypothetical protein
MSDDLYDELSRLNNELVNAQRQLARQNSLLEAALARVKRLEGMLAICSGCHKIRDEDNVWHRFEQYLADYSDVSFSHGLCPECLERLYPERGG